jgi:hypothetical protein
MNAAFLVGTAALMTSVAAAELDDRFLRLIGPDAKLVYGVDLDRYGDSTLKEFFPIGASEYASQLQNSGSILFEMVVAERDDSGSAGRLAIFRGALSFRNLTPQGAHSDIAADNYKGVPIRIGRDQSFALLEPNIAIAGTLPVLKEAIDRWQKEPVPSDSFRSTLRDLSRSYDNWFLVRKPLQLFAWPQTPESVYGSKLVQAVEAIEGGIRLGGMIELHLEAVTKSSEDAATAAAIARWWPGFTQLDSRGDPKSAILDLTEDLTILTTGNVASLSFRLSERRLRELAEKLHATPESSSVVR